MNSDRNTFYLIRANMRLLQMGVNVVIHRSKSGLKKNCFQILQMHGCEWQMLASVHLKCLVEKFITNPLFYISCLLSQYLPMNT